MSNLWFNDDGFSLGQPPGDNDMMGSMFDDISDLPGQQLSQHSPAPRPGQQQQQTPGQQQPQAPPQTQLQQLPQPQQLPQTQAQPQMGDPMMDFQPELFAKQDKSPLMYMRQPESVSPGMNQQFMARAKQDQLAKMRQQVMHQQMLQRNSKQYNNASQMLQRNQLLVGQGNQLNLSLANANQLGQNNVGLVNQGNQSQQNHAGQNQALNNTNSPGQGQSQFNRNPSNSSNMSQNMPNMQSIPNAQNMRGMSNAQNMQGMSNAQNMQNLSQNMQSGPSMPNMANQNPNAPKLSSAQVAQLQHELFQMTISDFMARRGTPITQPPTINNKRVNLLVLHILSRKIGGPQAVLKLLQTLNQPTLQVTEWTSVCQKLGLLEGIDPLNVAAKLQVEKLLGLCYLQYILPYEQYTLTEDGLKDIQARRMQFQRQLFMRLQQRQGRQNQFQNNQTQRSLNHGSPTPNQYTPALNQPLNQNQNQNQNQPLNQNVNQNQNQVHNENTNPNQNQSPNVNQSHTLLQNQNVQSQSAQTFQSPHLDSAKALQSPGLQMQSPFSGFVASPANQPSPAISANSHRLSNASNHTSPSVQSPHHTGSRSNSVKQSIPTRFANDSAATPQEQAPETPQGEPNTIKKYVPIKVLADTLGSGSLKTVSDLGDEIELTKPVYLFAPELGSLNIHALVMSLKNYTHHNPGETFSALNTLLVTTTDPNFLFKISDAPEILDALVDLGSKILDQVLLKPSNAPDYLDISYSSNDGIDSVFNKYVHGGGMKGEDLTLVVDSLTAEIVEDEDSDIEIDELFSPEEIASELAELLESGPEETDTCEMPDFMTGLQMFREENKHHFSKIQTKSATDERIYLVDALITVTMTLRNLSFTENAGSNMVLNKPFKKFLFRIIKSIVTTPSVFIFQRKRLCLLKDCLLILDRVAFLMELETLEEAFLVFLLVSAFGPKLDDHEDEPERRYSIPSAPFDVFTYLPCAVDVFTKLLVREPKNRALFQAILTGTMSTSLSSNNPNASSITISPQDSRSTRKLMVSYLKGNETAIRQGIFLSRAFMLLMSCIPYTAYAGNGVETTRFVFQRSSTVLQALFGAKLLIDLVPMEEVNGNLTCLPCSWLASNVQILLFNFTKNTFSLITESVKFARSTAEHRVLSFVGFKALVVVNSLVASVVILKKAMAENELSAERTAELEKNLGKFKDLYRVQPEADFVLNAILAATIDPDVAHEVMRFRGLMAQVQ